MLDRPRAAGFVWPTLLALPALAVLIGLGTWQMQRKAWKEELIGQIRTRTTAAPLPLDQVIAYMTATHAPGEREAIGEYSRVTARGRLGHDRELYIYAPDARLGPGYWVLTPLYIPNPGCNRFVMVNRGYVPEALKPPGKRTAGQLPGIVEVVGLVRLPQQPGTFTPANDPARNLWFWRDLQAMTRAIDSSGQACPVGFFIDALPEPANPGGWPRGGTTNPEIPNRHLEYALTWYALALTLLGVLTAFAAGKLREIR